MANRKTLGQAKRDYYQTQLSSTNTSVTDLERDYYNNTLSVSGRYIPDLHVEYLQGQTSLTTRSLSTLWQAFMTAQGVGASTSYTDRLVDFFDNYGYPSGGDVLRITSAGDTRVTSAGDSRAVA